MEQSSVAAISLAFLSNDWEQVSAPELFELSNGRVYIRVLFVDVDTYKASKASEKMAKELGMEFNTDSLAEVGRCVPQFFDSKEQALGYKLNTVCMLRSSDWNSKPKLSSSESGDSV